MVLSNGKTDSVGETLTKRASSDFNAFSIVRFGMTRSDAVYCLDRSKLEYAIYRSISESTYSEGLKVIDGKFVPGDVKESVLEHAGVSVAIFCQ